MIMQQFYVTLGSVFPVIFLLTSVKGNRTVCNEDKIFINYHSTPSASGWYTQNTPSCIFTKSNSHNLKFNLLEDDDIWKLLVIEETNHGGSYIHTIYNTTNNIANMFHTQPTNLKTIKRERFLFHPSNLQDSEKEVSVNMGRFNRNRSLRLHVEEDDWLQKDSEELHNEIALPLEQPKMVEIQENLIEEVKIYYSKRCLCTKLEIQYQGVRYSDFYRLDTNQNLLDKCNITLNDESANETNSHQWRPESFVSEYCQLLDYHSNDDTWWAELSQHCSPSEKGIYLIWSNDSAPCIEYLPPQHQQVWMYYSQLSVFDNQDNPNNIYMENCGYFKKSIYENFTVECVAME